MIDIEELERLAKAATPGPWTSEHYFSVDAVHPLRNDADGTTLLAFMSGSFDRKANGQYITAANPATILQLIALVKAANSVSEVYKQAMITGRAIAKQMFDVDSGFKQTLIKEEDALAEKCKTCEGYGFIGDYSTDGSEQTEDCPDCTAPADDGWIKWEGGKNPVPGKNVSIKYDGGFESNEDKNKLSNYLDWTHSKHDTYWNIIAYRVVPT